MSAVVPRWMRWMLDGNGSTNRTEVVDVEHDVVEVDANGRRRHTKVTRPTIKPRDRSKYQPRPRNGTPRRLHSEAFQRGFR